MKQTKIDLSEPFEKVLAALLSAPQNEKFGEGGARNATAAMDPKRDDPGAPNLPQLTEVLRRLYETAHGRQAATQIGLVAIPSPVVPSLRQAPFYIKTQVDFLIEALIRIISSASNSNRGVRVQQRSDKKYLEGHDRNNHTSHIEKKNAGARIQMPFQPLSVPNGRRFAVR